MGTWQPLGLCITPVTFGDCGVAVGKVFPSREIPLRMSVAGRKVREAQGAGPELS